MSEKTDRVAVVATNSTDFVKILFDCLAERRVVVPIRSADDQYRLDVAQVSEVITPEAGHGWMAYEHTPCDDDTLAQILFTSGTEGEPKGIELTHRALADIKHSVDSTARFCNMWATMGTELGQ